jgi:hypothetical protein
MIRKTYTRVSSTDYDDVGFRGQVGCGADLVEGGAVCEPEGER